MKLCLNGATTMKANLWTDIAAARAAGFSLLEIWAEKLDAAVRERGIREVRAAFDAADVRPWAINSIEHISFRTPTDEAGIRARCGQLADLARELGCPNLVVVPGFAPAGVSARTVEDESCRILTELADVAGPGVHLAFEFIGGQGLSIATLAECRAVVERCARPDVGMVIDSFHFHAGGSSFADFDGLDPARIFIVHLNDAEDRPRDELRDCHRLLPGLGILPLRELLSRLRNIGYDGVVSVEIFRPEYWDRDPAELARACRAAMETVIRSAGFVF